MFVDKLPLTERGVVFLFTIPGVITTREGFALVTCFLALQSGWPPYETQCWVKGPNGLLQHDCILICILSSLNHEI